jgi:hypothetical protein
MIAPPERPNTSMSGQPQAGPTGYGQSSGAHSTSAFGQKRTFNFEKFLLPSNAQIMRALLLRRIDLLVMSFD